MLYALIYLQIKSQCFAHFSEKPEAACPTGKVTRLGLKGTLRSFATDLLFNLGQVISFLCASSFPLILCVFYSGCSSLEQEQPSRFVLVLCLRAGPPLLAEEFLLDPTTTQRVQSLNSSKEFGFHWQDLQSLSLASLTQSFSEEVPATYWVSKFPVKGLK